MDSESFFVRVHGIAGKLKQAIARGVRPFGADEHGFRLKPPLSEAEVAAFELCHGVKLAEGYRAFLTHVADGWAGPAYGLFPLAETVHRQPRSGTLVLCDEGCGYRHFLVLTGPERGQMWLDATVGDDGYHPLGVDFLEWYERWLDDALAGKSGTWWLRPSGT